jgi:hypothetical protein
MTFRSILSYGPPGAGKSAFGVSSFWDYINLKPVPGETGKWLLLGRESNNDLGVPEDCIRRFPFEGLSSMQWINDLSTYLRNLVAAARKGTGPTNIVFDGWTELGAGFEITYKALYTPTNKFETWEKWREKFFEIVQLLNPEVLNANIFTTARVRDFKEGFYDEKNKKTTGRDPEWLEGLRYPAIDGWAKHNLGHYFNFVFYHEQVARVKAKQGKTIPVTPAYRVYTVPVGDVLVKNIVSHRWAKLGLPAVLENSNWPELKAKLEGGE